MTERANVVVGGGIGGIIAAHFLKTNASSRETILIESSNQLGGLLRSVKSANGLFFDLGTHIPAQTLIPELDEWLFDDVESSQNYTRIEKILGGHILNNRLDETSFSLPSQGWHDALVDGEPVTSPTNLVSDYKFRFGRQLTGKMFLPCISKFLEQPLEQFEPDVQKYFALDRLSNHRGRTPEMDASSPLSLTRPETHLGRRPSAYYPSTGEGVGSWTAHLESKLIRDGIRIVTQCKITDIVAKEGQIRQLKLSSGEKIEAANIIWTAPVETLCTVADAAFGDSFPTFYSRAPTRLFHMVIDKPYASSCHYINCFDPGFSPYRITLYENFAKTTTRDDYRCTVEVVGNRATDRDISVDVILTELKEMGILKGSSKCMMGIGSELINGFPMKKVGAEKQSRKLVENVTEKYANIHLTGSALPQTFFANEVMSNTYKSIMSLITNQQLL